MRGKPRGGKVALDGHGRPGRDGAGRPAARVRDGAERQVVGRRADGFEEGDVDERHLDEEVAGDALAGRQGAEAGVRRAQAIELARVDEVQPFGGPLDQRPDAARDGAAPGDVDQIVDRPDPAPVFDGTGAVNADVLNLHRQRLRGHPIGFGGGAEPAEPVHDALTPLRGVGRHNGLTARARVLFAQALGEEELPPRAARVDGAGGHHPSFTMS